MKMPILFSSFLLVVAMSPQAWSDDVPAPPVKTPVAYRVLDAKAVRIATAPNHGQGIEGGKLVPFADGTAVPFCQAKKGLLLDGEEHTAILVHTSMVVWGMTTGMAQLQDERSGEMLFACRQWMGDFTLAELQASLRGFLELTPVP